MIAKTNLMRIDPQLIYHRGVRWFVDPQLRGNFVEAYRPLLSLMAGEAPPVEKIKESSGADVVRIPAPGEADAHAYLKVYRKPGYRYVFRSPPGVREGRALLRMKQFGIPVPRFVACAIASTFPTKSCSAVLSVTEDRFHTFGYHAYRILECESQGKEALAPALEELFRLLRRMHDMGFFHGDVNLGNILFDPAGNEFRFIDFHRSASWVSREEWFALAREMYFRNEPVLEQQVRAQWDRVVNERMHSKAASTARDARLGRRRFRIHQSPNTTLYHDRLTGHEPQQILEYLSKGFPEGVRKLEEFDNDREAVKAWSAYVYRTAADRENTPQEAIPLALAVFHSAQKGPKAVLLGVESADRPEYSLEKVFSLARFRDR